MAGRHLFSLMFILLLLANTVACRPVPTRGFPEFPFDFEALAEMPVEHFGLIDDYGVVPKHPSFHPHRTHKQPKGLVQARKSKRVEPNSVHLYYDDIM